MINLQQIKSINHNLTADRQKKRRHPFLWVVENAQSLKASNMTVLYQLLLICFFLVSITYPTLTPMCYFQLIEFGSDVPLLSNSFCKVFPHFQVFFRGAKYFIPLSKTFRSYLSMFRGHLTCILCLSLFWSLSALLYFFEMLMDTTVAWVSVHHTQGELQITQV